MKRQPWSTKKTLIYAIIFSVGLLIAFAWQRWYWPTTTIRLADQVLDVQIARSIYQQHKGLGGRKSLDPHDGLLFSFVLLDQHAFVMRDMEFAIDIIWFKNGQVVDIASNVGPEVDIPEYDLHKYYPRTDANLVLEVPAGWAMENGLKIGDFVQLVE